MVATQDYIWEQGDDLVVDITYQINGTPQDLTGYSVRMDIAPLVSGQPQSPVFSFNSDDSDAETEDEIVLDENGKIRITIDRHLTLDEGAIDLVLGSSPSAEFGYDLFLRDTSNRQKKLLQGKILVRRSITKWA